MAAVGNRTAADLRLRHVLRRRRIVSAGVNRPVFFKQLTRFSVRAQFDIRLEVAAQAVDAVNGALKRIAVDRRSSQLSARISLNQYSELVLALLCGPIPKTVSSS